MRKDRVLLGVVAAQDATAGLVAKGLAEARPPGTVAATTTGTPGSSGASARAAAAPMAVWGSAR